MLNAVLIYESLEYNIENIIQKKSTFIAITSTGEQFFLIPPRFNCNTIIKAEKDIKNRWYWMIESNTFIDTLNKV